MLQAGLDLCGRLELSFTNTICLPGLFFYIAKLLNQQWITLKNISLIKYMVSKMSISPKKVWTFFLWPDPSFPGLSYKLSSLIISICFVSFCIYFCFYSLYSRRHGGGFLLWVRKQALCHPTLTCWTPPKETGCVSWECLPAELPEI